MVEDNRNKAENAQEELLKRARRVKSASDRSEEARTKHSKIGKLFSARKHTADMVDGFAHFFAIWGWVYDKIILPIIGHPYIDKFLDWYKQLWRKIVYVPDKDGVIWFSKSKGGMMVLATGFALWMTPAIIFVTVELFWDSAAMVTTYKKDEIWYLGKSQEIDHEGNVFSAQGCAAIACSDQTSIYFRIKPSIAHHIWSLINNGNIFFPDFVAAGIQNDVNKCTVTGYGARWKFLVRNWDVYPQILSVNCVPLTESEINQRQEEEDQE